MLTMAVCSLLVVLLISLFTSAEGFAQNCVYNKIFTADYNPDLRPESPHNLELMHGRHHGEESTFSEEQHADHQSEEASNEMQHSGQHSENASNEDLHFGHHENASVEMMNSDRHSESMSSEMDHAGHSAEGSGSDVLHVDFMFYFRTLGGLNERDEVLETVGYNVIEWYDYRLQWDPDECNGTRQIKVPSLRLWLPDLIIANGADEFSKFIFKRDFGSWVRYDGLVHWSHAGLFRTVCVLNLQKYPFDEHNCSINIESWLYNSSELEFHAVGAGIDSQTVVKDTQWSLEGLEAHYQELSPGWPGAMVSFVWKRKIAYHVFNIICPTIFIMVVALGIFWLPADCGEKVSLAISVLLAFSVIQLLIMDILPPSSENIPNISILVVGVMTLSTISVLTSMAVVYVSFKPAATPVPRALRKVLYSRITWLAALKDELPFGGFTELDVLDTTSSHEVYTNKSLDHNHVNLSDVTLSESSDTPPTQNGGLRPKNGLKPQKHLTEKLRYLRGIHNELKVLVRHQEENEKDGIIVNEWKTLGKLVDRILFAVCLFMLVVLVFTFLRPT